MYELINKLSPADFQQLGRFVMSPFFNSNKKVITLYEALSAHYPNVSKDHVSYEEVAKLFGKSGSFRNDSFRKLMSDFTSVCEEFILQMEFRGNKDMRLLMLLSSLRKKNCRKRFERNYNELMRKFGSAFSKDGDYYFLKANVLAEKYRYDFDEEVKGYSEILQEQTECVDNYFLFEKLHLFHQMYQSVHKPADFEKYRWEWHEEVLNRIETRAEHYRRNHPNIYIIYLTLRMFEENDDTSLKELIEYLEGKIRKFSPTKLRYYFSYVASYCLMKANQGEDNYRGIAFDVYSRMDETGLLDDDDAMTETDFLNIVNIAISEKKLAWVSVFINRHRKAVLSSIGQDAFSLARAKLMFYEKKYDSMFALLNGIDYKDPNYYINSKILLFRAYIEHGETERARMISENLRQYERTNKQLFQLQKRVIKLFVKYSLALTNLPQFDVKKRNKTKKELLDQLLSEKPPVPTKTWFIEKFS